MSIVRNAIKWNFTLQAAKPSNGLSLPLLRALPKRFSTETERPHSSPPQSEAQDSKVDPFLEAPRTGRFYGKLWGITRHTLKTDIINLLEGCNLTLDDIKVDYNRTFWPAGMMVQFPSRLEYDNALKVITKKGRLYRLERADRSQWDLLSPYDGKTILLQGIPRNALQDDVERFLSGCDYDASSIRLFTRAAIPDPIRMALIRLPSQIQAMNAFITKNRTFCLNNQITVRVLQ